MKTKILMVGLGLLTISNIYLILRLRNLELDLKYLEKVSEFTLKSVNEDYSESDKEIAEILKTYYNRHVKK